MRGGGLSNRPDESRCGQEAVALPTLVEHVAPAVDPAHGCIRLVGEGHRLALVHPLAAVTHQLDEVAVQEVVAGATSGEDGVGVDDFRRNHFYAVEHGAGVGGVLSTGAGEVIGRTERLHILRAAFAVGENDTFVEVAARPRCAVHRNRGRLEANKLAHGVKTADDANVRIKPRACGVAGRLVAPLALRGRVDALNSGKARRGQPVAGDGGRNAVRLLAASGFHVSVIGGGEELTLKLIQKRGVSLLPLEIFEALVLLEHIAASTFVEHDFFFIPCRIDTGETPVHADGVQAGHAGNGCLIAGLVGRSGARVRERNNVLDLVAAFDILLHAGEKIECLVVAKLRVVDDLAGASQVRRAGRVVEKV